MGQDQEVEWPHKCQGRPKEGATLKALWKPPQSQLTLARYAERSQESSTVWPQNGCIKSE